MPDEEGSVQTKIEKAFSAPSKPFCLRVQMKKSSVAQAVSPVLVLMLSALRVLRKCCSRAGRIRAFVCSSLFFLNELCAPMISYCFDKNAMKALETQKPMPGEICYAACPWNLTVGQRVPECRFLTCIHSDSCYALNAAVRHASSHIKLGGYSEHIADDRRCLTGRERSYIQPHLCKQTHE